MKILAIQNRMGIGDMVIFLPFIEAISKKFKSPVSLLVKKSAKASEFLYGGNPNANISDKTLFIKLKNILYIKTIVTSFNIFLIQKFWIC